MIFGLPITFLRQVAHIGLQPEAVLGGGAEGQAGGHLRLQVADGGHVLHVAAGLEHLAGLLHGPAHRPRRHSLCTLSALAQFFQSGFVQKKNTFKMHQLLTNLCNMAWKCSTKVGNSSAHPVKGRNPYCSRWPMHSISQN